MNLEEKQALLSELTTEKTKAFPSGGGPDVSIVQLINSRLQNLNVEDRPYFKGFVEELKNNLFEAGANIPGLNLSSFQKEGETQDPIEAAEEIQTESQNVKSYFDSFLELMDCLKNDLPTLKNYFFIRLQSNSDLNYKPVLIYETGCFYQSVRKRLMDKFPGCLCKSIAEIKDELEKKQLPATSLIAILIVSTKINEEEKVDEVDNHLKTIFSYFDEVYYLSPKTLSTTKHSDVISTNDSESFLEEIKYVTSTFLTNAELSNEEERIIKKLFQDSNCPILEYKVLKGGKSGAKVIEIKPKKNYATDLTKRFIVKFGPLNEKKKISKEAKRFGDHIEHYSIPDYQKTHVKNAMVEAIKYTYASENSIRTSYSFSDILNNPENEFYLQKNKILEDVFSGSPFDLWQQSEENGTNKISDLYSDYISPEKFFNNVKRIKGISDVELENEAIVKNFKKIFDLSINSKVKVCHGDLHSENFFKDVNNIYLIDFGFTDKRHAVVDHTSLECSLKFKHVPFYVDLKVLEEIENQLLSEDAFNATFAIKTTREDVKEYFNLVKIVRMSSLRQLSDSGSKLEYLISLFIMTCRHAQYPDLNQLYALKSAEILGGRLVQLLS
jgi:hypothetical protein